jgi:hypothetical protein
MTVLDDNTSKANDPPAEVGAAAGAAVTVRINLPDKAKTKKKNGASAAAASSSAPRRIVKASLPKPASADEAERAVAAAAAASHDDDDDDDNEDDENKHHHNYHPDPYLRGAGLDSPLVREAANETVQHVKQEQIRTSAGLRKIKTDLAMNERRHKTASSAAPNGTKSAAATSTASASAKANPFSRFLSVFSVEPAHPEHKRGLSQAGGPEHDDDRDDGMPHHANGSGGGAGAGPHPPIVKKPRKDDAANNTITNNKSSDAVFVGNVDATTAMPTSTHRSTDNNSNDKDRPADQAPWYARIFSNLATNPHHPSPTAVSMVAVATVAVWVAWRWSRNSAMLGSPSA